MRTWPTWRTTSTTQSAGTRRTTTAGAAGEHAQTFFASRAAVEHLTRALEAAMQLGLAVPAKLYRSRGQSYEVLGEFEHARRDFEKSLEIARAADDGVGEWQSLIDLGFLWAGQRLQADGGAVRARARAGARGSMTERWWRRA